MAAEGEDLMSAWWKSIVLLSVLVKSLLIPSYYNRNGSSLQFEEPIHFPNEYVVFCTLPILMAFLFPRKFSYHESRSTDFEVHRNWLAITNSLPMSKWYFEDTSEWTLDYPPLFAWFEFVLSQIAKYVDPAMVVVKNLKYCSLPTVLFQRGSVMLTDLILAYAVKEHCSYLGRRAFVTFQHCLILGLLLIFNCGLLIVDHIHFQYNGFLFGILLLSITRISEGRTLEGSFWFAVLLNFKHIFLYIAPAYFVFLLRSYCFQSSSSKKTDKHFVILGANVWDFSPLKLARLGFVVVFVFGTSFGPFIAVGQLPQVLSRLFPFKRGLCHAYWAPNFWALYNALDKAVAVVGNKVGFIPGHLLNRQASMTGGLVGQSEHLILPTVPPIFTMVLTLVAVLPALFHLWFQPYNMCSFLRSVVLCAFGSFLFGWHVHEKAILMVIIPLSLLAVVDRKDARVFLVLATTGHLSLFPLLFQPQETPIKVCLMLIFTVFSFYSLCLIHCGKSTEESTIVGLFRLPIVEWYEGCYLYGLLALEVYCSAIHPWTVFAQKLPFLPLMLTSIYCAVGVLWAWLVFYYDTLRKQAVNATVVTMATKPVTTSEKKKSKKRQ